MDRGHRVRGQRAEDRHYTFDPVHGEITLGPAVRQEDGTYDQYGFVPPKGADLRHGDVHGRRRLRRQRRRRTISVLRTAIPYVSRVENREPAQGGVDGETLDEAKSRGPIVLRTRSRA